jgi:hypothetical protein
VKANALQQMVRTGRPAFGLTSLAAKLISLLTTAAVSAVNAGVAEASGNAGTGFAGCAKFIRAAIAVFTSPVRRIARHHESRVISSKSIGINWVKRYNIRGLSPQVAAG